MVGVVAIEKILCLVGYSWISGNRKKTELTKTRHIQFGGKVVLTPLTNEKPFSNEALLDTLQLTNNSGKSPVGLIVISYISPVFFMSQSMEVPVSSFLHVT